MAKLTTQRRNTLHSMVFGLPGQRKYPMPDQAHAANAKARAKQQLNAGNLSQGQFEQVIDKANDKLGE